MTQKEFQSKIDAICSCMEQESREQMVERLYQEQISNQHNYIEAITSRKKLSANGNCGHPDEFVGTWEDGTYHCWECEWQKLEQQMQQAQGNADFNLALSTCANSVHINYGGVTSKRELIEETLRKYFEPLVKRLEQVEEVISNADRVHKALEEITGKKCLPCQMPRFVQDERDSLLAKVQSLEQQLVEARKDTELLNGLLNLTNNESSTGLFAVTLDYNNYQDEARVIDGDGNVLGECGDIDKEPNEQFRQAITLAMKEKSQ